jgi:hypothetical protein
MLVSIADYETTELTFKSSSKKSDHSLRYIPINLHLHIFKMTGEISSPPPPPSPTPSISSVEKPPLSHVLSNHASYTCDFMTVGAFAAHSMKFKSGGLWHMMKMFDDKLSKQTNGFVPALKNDFRLPDEVNYPPARPVYPSHRRSSHGHRSGMVSRSHSCHRIGRSFTWLTVRDKDSIFVSHNVWLPWYGPLIPPHTPLLHSSLIYRSLVLSLVSASCPPLPWREWHLSAC